MPVRVCKCVCVRECERMCARVYGYSRRCCLQEHHGLFKNITCRTWVDDVLFNTFEDSGLLLL
jgi:hypothetical protein